MKKNHENFKVGRIMIVDDEAELMTALCEALAVQGYETMGFTTGADALKVLVEQDYDLLLTDLMMPEMDGIALLQAGLEIDPNLVGIIMTGHGTVQTAVEAMKKGAFDYVLKPFKLNTLLPLLSRAMEVRSLRMENIQLRETVAIHELGKVIAFSSDLNAILNKVADATLQQCNADEVSIMLPTRDGKELYVAVSRGGHREYIGERVPMERGIAGWVARNRETVIINGKVDDPRFSPVQSAHRYSCRRFHADDGGRQSGRRIECQCHTESSPHDAGTSEGAQHSGEHHFTHPGKYMVEYTDPRCGRAIPLYLR